MKRILSILGISVLVFSCSVEEINHPSEADAPLAARFEPVVTVDQETNQVTFSLPSGTKGVIPVWVLQDKNGEFTTYAAQDGLTKIFTSAGDYKVRLQIMNAAGVSPDYVEKTFHVDNTIVNFDRYIRFLAGTSSKQWRIDNTVPAHFGCGPSGTTGTEWWAAAPDEKAAVGLYDNRVTFTNEYGYTFDPGESGTLYVNTGVTAAPYGAFNTNDGQDYTVPVDPQQATYSFEVSGDDLFLVLPAGTRFPYIPNADFMKNPRFRVESADNNTLNLVCDNGEIAWHFTLTSKAAATVFNGFNYTAESNLWKPADADGGLTLSYYYAPGWAQIADPVLEKSGSKYTWTLPSATSDRWQAQMFLVPSTPISLSAAMQYDFSCILSASADVTVKVKVHRFDENGSDADNGVVLVDADVPLKAGEDVVFWKSALDGIDANNIRIVLDWGGNPDNAEVSASRIVLKDHAIDDGTVLPGGDDTPTDGPREYKYDSDANLWKGADADGGLTLSYYYAPGWAQIADPALEKAGAKYTWTLPSATSDRWQAQMFLVPVTPISLTEDASYDFSCVLSASADVTPKVKIHRFDENGSDADNGVVLLDVDVPLKAGEDVIVDASALAGIAAGNIRIVLDWGGNPDNAEVSINRIVLKDHSVDDGTHQGGGSDEVKFDYDAASNLWKAADQAHTYSYYYAPGWAQIADPKTTQEGNVYTLSFPEATFDQWQAQFFIIPDAPIALSAEKAYDFQVILNSSTDHGNITLKLTDTTDDGNFLFTNMVAAEAYEDMVFRFTNLPGIDAEAVKLVFDFGRNAADTEITIREIILQEHVAGSGGEPEPGPGPDVPGEDPLRIDAPSNLWRSASMNNTFWYADGGWSQIADPMTFPADDFGGLKVIIPYEIGGSEWQGQTVWHTDIKATAGETYDFGFTVNSDEDIYAMTVKLAWEGHDGDHAFFYENSISVKARETFKFRKIEIAPDVDYDKVVLFIDLGRCKRGTAVSFTDFCFQPHGQWYDVDGTSNLWNSATVTNTYWYADGGWSQIANPETQALANHGLKVTIPAGIGGAEWQGQTVWHTDIPASADKKYDFCCRILSDEDAVLTVKLAWEGNDNDHAFFYENAVSVKAGESFRFEKPGISPDADYDKIVLFIDCGRCPAGSEVSFTGFCFQEHID